MHALDLACYITWFLWLSSLHISKMIQQRLLHDTIFFPYQLPTNDRANTPRLPGFVQLRSGYLVLLSQADMSHCRSGA